MITSKSPSWFLTAVVTLTRFGCEPLNAASQVEFWLTDPRGSARFQRQTRLVPSPVATSDGPTIEVDEAKRYQTLDGFGYTLTGGSAQHLMRMTAPARAALLRELFAADSTNIGVSYLRVSIGASDLNERAFSYDDVPPRPTRI